MFAVVEFLDDNSVEVVPKTWLMRLGKDDYCYWPKFNHTKKAKKMEIPDKENWDQYHIRVFCIADTYERGKQLSIRAEETSNLESDAEEEQKRKRKKKTTCSDSESDDANETDEEQAIPRKVKSQRMLKLDGRGVEQTAGSLKKNPRLPTPPHTYTGNDSDDQETPVRVIYSRQAMITSPAPNSQDRQAPAPNVQGRQPCTSRQPSENAQAHPPRESCIPTRPSTPRSSELERTKQITSAITPPPRNSREQQPPPSIFQGTHSSQFSTPQPCTSRERRAPSRCLNELERDEAVDNRHAPSSAITPPPRNSRERQPPPSIFQGTQSSQFSTPQPCTSRERRAPSRCLNELERDEAVDNRHAPSSAFQISVTRRLMAMEGELRDQSGMLQRILHLLDERSEEQPPLLEGPVNTMEELEALEANLADADYSNKMVAYLSSLGGADEGDKMRRIMRKLGTYFIWSHFSNKGQKGKKKLDGWKVYNVMKRAFMKQNKDASEKTAEIHISNMLKQAPYRPGGVNVLAIQNPQHQQENESD